MVAAIQGYGPTQQAGVPTQGPALNAMDRVTSEQLNRPGLYSLDQAVMADIGIQPPKEHHGVFHALGKFIVEALVVGAVAVGARKGLFHNIKGVDAEGDVKKLIEPAKDAKFVDKAKYYYAKYTDLAYDKTVGKVLKYLKDKKAAKADETPKTDNAEAPAGAPATGENVDTKA